MTYLEKLKELKPDYKKYAIISAICPTMVFSNLNELCYNNKNANCEKCWNQIYET